MTYQQQTVAVDAPALKAATAAAHGLSLSYFSAAVAAEVAAGVAAAVAEATAVVSSGSFFFSAAAVVAVADVADSVVSANLICYSKKGTGIQSGTFFLIHLTLVTIWIILIPSIHIGVGN